MAARTNKRSGGAVAARPLVLGLLAAGAGAVWAQSPPAPPQLEQGRSWYVGAQQTFVRDSNVFRRPAATSDTISSTGVLGGVNLEFGRQQLRADLSAARNNYKDEDQLDNTSYRADVALNWSTIERLSGVLGAGARKQLARFDIDDPSVSGTQRNPEEARYAMFIARLGMTSILGLEGRLEHRDLDFPDAAVAVRNLGFEQNTVGLGVRYRPSGILTLGLGARVGKGEFKDATSTDYDRRDVDLTARWEPTGASIVTARLSHTDTDTNTPSAYDTSGVTGALRWDWRPTGKLRLISDLQRETGTHASFAEFQFVLPSGESGTALVTGETARRINSARIRALWELTAKILVEAQARYQTRTFVTTGFEDKTSLLNVGLRWEPTRTIGLGCGVGREERDSDTAAANYTANLAHCFAQFVLR